MQLLKEQLGIRTLNWPSKSPDKNPIEHVWDFVKRRVQQDAPQNTEQLRLAVLNAWQQLPQEFINRLVIRMPRRVTALLHARGSYTRY